MDPKEGVSHPFLFYKVGDLCSHSALEQLQLDEILKWLSPSNAAQSQKEISSKRTAPGTGKWFLEGEDFKKWSKTPNSFLWLKGDSEHHSIIISLSFYT
jgi:hypothetical protein